MKPSLEGWKHLEAPDVAKVPGLLETFLRGMETGSRPRRTGAITCLETFLRGMETPQHIADKGLELPLKPSLEGWKLFAPIPSLRLLGGLETFLRGMETDQRPGQC